MSLAVGPVKRVTLWVRDIDESLALYRDLLGLSVLEDKLLDEAAVRALLGVEGGRLRIVHLGAGEVPHGWIGLYALTDARPAPPSLPAPGRAQFSYGQAVVVFETRRIEELRAMLVSRRYRLLGPAIDYFKHKGSPQSPAGRYREVVFFDPDDIPVSLIQFDPA